MKSQMLKNDSVTNLHLKELHKNEENFFDNYFSFTQ